MVTIESNTSSNNYLGLLKNFPTQVLSKLNISNSFLSKNIEPEIEVVIISGDSVDKVSKFVDNLGGEYQDLGYNFAIAKISVDKLLDLALSPLIQYIELPKSLYTTDLETNSASCIPQATSTYNLDGSGVLLGFIDTGIDYTHPAFINDDGTTRIEYIYDLSLNGKIYDKKIINEALKSEDPFSIVDSVDIAGHGTHVVGIACAGGKIEKKFYGVAPKSSIAMVKVARSQFALSTQIMKGIRFLINKSKELSMPLVINMSLSTNDGAHNGSSLLEQYISIVSALERTTLVIAAGNEGEAAHHIGKEIDDLNEIYFDVGDEEVVLAINLYKSILPTLSIELMCPCGFSSGEIFLAEGFRTGRIGNSIYEIYYTGPKPFDISGEIGIILRGSSEYVSAGQWKITLKKNNEYDGFFEMWLPTSEGLNTKTKFLNPTIYNTLGIPATVKSVISVGSYNSLTNNISPFSGRGEKFQGQYIKPDIVAPGEDVYSTIPNRSFDRKTGTSMATPNVTGICGLMMQWGIVKQNDPYLYGERLKYYLVVGGKKGRRDVNYPDPAWGYGEVCAYNSLQLTSQMLGSRKSEKDFNYRQNDNEDTSKDQKVIDSDVKKISDNVSTTSESNIQGENTEQNQYKNDRVKILVEVPIQEKFQEVLKLPNVVGVKISDTFAVIITPESEIDKISEIVNSVVNFDLLPIFTLGAISPVEASGAPAFNDNPYLRLKGSGVLVGIIDTGIDYLSDEFKREDDTSRIFRLWDQNIEGTEKIYDLKYGMEYTEEQITEAIAAQKKGIDPYSIVPSKDEIGHGTMMAGIIGGRGINPELKGSAPDCEFVIVKLAQANEIELKEAYIDSKVPGYSAWNILLALRYIGVVANTFAKPVVIYIPLGANIGSHTGVGIVERSIENFTGQVGTLVITNTGNQGDTATHAGGVIESKDDVKEIELRVGKNQKILPIQIWINRPNIVTLSIISPSGEIISNLNSKLSRNSVIKFTYEGTEMNINFISPEYTTGDSEIIIKASNLRVGIWKFRLKGEYIVDGKYYAWIPQRELLDVDTKFLNPSEDTTLTILGTSQGAITVAYYNQNNNSVVAESGRGYTRNNIVKPEIAAGGVKATVLKPGGQVGIASGASIAGAVVAGGCALILQWAVIDKNDVKIYSSQVKSYIIAGAKTRPGDLYPNRSWGYGTFDLQGIFDTIREVYSEDNTKRLSADYEEYKVGRLFIRKPVEI